MKHEQIKAMVAHSLTPRLAKHMIAIVKATRVHGAIEQHEMEPVLFGPRKLRRRTAAVGYVIRALEFRGMLRPRTTFVLGVKAVVWHPTAAARAVAEAWG